MPDLVIENLEKALRILMKKYDAVPIKAMINKHDKQWLGKTGGYYVKIQGRQYIVRFRKNLFEKFAEYYQDLPKEFQEKGCGLNKSEVLNHIKEGILCIEVLGDGRILVVDPQDVIDFALEFRTFKKLADMNDIIYNVPVNIMISFDEYLESKTYVSWKERFKY